MWSFYYTTASIKCRACRIAKQRCFPRGTEWGILTWPKLTPSEIGSQRRDRDKILKRQKTQQEASKQGAASMARESSTGSMLLDDGEPASPVPPSPVSSTVELTNRDARQVAPMRGFDGADLTLRKGRNEVVFFEDLVKFEAPLRDPSSSATFLMDTLSQVDRLIRYEKERADTINAFVESRQEILEMLRSRLENASSSAMAEDSRREGKGGGEIEESEMEDGEYED